MFWRPFYSIKQIHSSWCICTKHTHTHTSWGLSILKSFRVIPIHVIQSYVKTSFFILCWNLKVTLFISSYGFMEVKMDEEIKQHIISILVWSGKVIDEDNLLNNKCEFCWIIKIRNACRILLLKSLSPESLTACVEQLNINCFLSLADEIIWITNWNC